ncbi:hypothetical protein THAOC_25016, partial [Thalassiosira oceanica]
KCLVVGCGVNLGGHGGNRDVKAAKGDEAAREGGVLMPDSEETKDSWLDEVCLDLLTGWTCIMNDTADRINLTHDGAFSVDYDYCYRLILVHLDRYLPSIFI